MDEENIKNDSQEKLNASTKQELDSYLNQDTNVKSYSISNTISSVPTNNETLKNPTGEVNKVEQKVRPIVRTYKSDMEETIRSQHISSLNIAVAENNKMFRRMTEESSLEEKKSDKNYKIFILIIILVIAGLLAFVIPYFLVKEEFSPTPEEEDVKNISSLVTPDSVERINVDVLVRDRIAKTLNERTEQVSMSLGSIKQFYITEGQSTSTKEIISRKFFELIKARVPDGLSRTLKDQFMFGVHGLGKNEKFLILKVGSYETTYAAMLSWEVAMWFDFSELFGLGISQEVDSLGRPIIGEEVMRFQDVIVKNKDTRVVKDEEGKIIFMYSVVDKNTVILTTNQDTFKEILNRFDKMSVTR